MLPRQIRLRSSAWMTCALWLCGLHSLAGTPDWLQEASREPIAKDPADAPAVMLRNEQMTTVKNNGEVTTVYRCAYRIVAPEGQRYGVVRIYFDSQTRINSIKGWSIPKTGGAYEVTEKAAIDTILFTGNLYEDARQKILRIPAADPGAVIGYEYEQRRRPSIFEDQWLFQQEIPVRQARFELRLPAAWEYRELWANHSSVPAQSRGVNQVAWELNDIPAVRKEPAMPAWQASSGRLLLKYFAPNGGSLRSWVDVGQWYSELVSDRRQVTAEMRQKVMDVTSVAPSPIGKIRALAAFVQQEVRYVAIEIGIGGYQPHMAQEIFENRYGDCKDKATLLSAMLGEIGVESYYVLINTRRGVVMRQFPSPLAFNHAILAIRIPEALTNGLYSSIKYPQMGSLVLFDPTDPHVPLGFLPAELQANYGLLVGNTGGELMELPLLPFHLNSLNRTATLPLKASGELIGEVQEIRTGGPAFDFRAAWLNSSESDRRKALQTLFGRQAGGVELSNISARDLDREGADPVLAYSFRLIRAATTAADLLLLRRRMFTEWGDDLMESSERKQPVEFPTATLQVESVQIALPDGYTVDELPPPVQADIGIASYSSRMELDGRRLQCSRRLEIRDVLVNTEQLAELKRFYRQIAAAEKASAVLKKQ